MFDSIMQNAKKSRLINFLLFYTETEID